MAFLFLKNLHLYLHCVKHTRSVQKVSSHLLWKIEMFIDEDTRYKKHCTWDNAASVPFKAGSLGPHTVLPIAISCFDGFSWISSMVWNLPFKGDFSFGKALSHRVPNLSYRGLSYLGDLVFCQKTLYEMLCISGCIFLMKLLITSCPWLWPSELSKLFFLDKKNRCTYWSKINK